MNFLSFKSEFIARWGAGLSTMLALVKFYELWRDRQRLDIGYTYLRDPDYGNQIMIRNLSSRKKILTRWQLLTCSGRWPNRSFEVFTEPDWDYNDQELEPHSTFTLMFSESEYFDWLKYENIYIRLFIAGQAPVLRKVYSR